MNPQTAETSSQGEENLAWRSPLAHSWILEPDQGLLLIISFQLSRVYFYAVIFVLQKVYKKFQAQIFSVLSTVR